ncbi:unnamed protein product [Amoebophrya sp. A120]|nr:unnamed protein product [Amoebophrya sp. A120]|eukprot:GSA120T00019407001.1
MSAGEVIFRRCPITKTDMRLLEDGNDLNDALLDFFLKLGQYLIPKQHNQALPNLHPLSSLFYGKLTGGQAKTGEEAWEQIKRWTLRIPNGIFTPPIIALPINETFLNEKEKPCGSHWWLALLVGAKNAAEKQEEVVLEQYKKIGAAAPPKPLHKKAGDKAELQVQDGEKVSIKFGSLVNGKKVDKSEQQEKDARSSKEDRRDGHSSDEEERHSRRRNKDRSRDRSRPERRSRSRDRSRRSRSPREDRDRRRKNRRSSRDRRSRSRSREDRRKKEKKRRSSASSDEDVDRIDKHKEELSSKTVANKAPNKSTEQLISKPIPKDIKRSFLLCVDSMTRRVVELNTDNLKEQNKDALNAVNKLKKQIKKVYKKGSLCRYSVEITRVEQAGHRVWLDFDARGDGSVGLLEHPKETAELFLFDKQGNKIKGIKPNDMGLRINNNNRGSGVLQYRGMLEFLVDSRDDFTGQFQFRYGPSWEPIGLEFDGYALSKFQKEVARYLQGMMKKEWERAKEKEKKALKLFDKTLIKAVAVDAPQQENLNDCGVFVLENCLNLLCQGNDYPNQILHNPLNPELKWVGQIEVRHRRRQLLTCVQHLFQMKEMLGTADIEEMLKKEGNLAQQLYDFLTSDPPTEMVLD